MPPSRRRLLLTVWLAWTLVQAIRSFAEGVERSARPVRTPIRPCLVDVDRARLPELQLLPGIGPERAKSIVLERVRAGPFGSVDALVRVPGIGHLTVDRIRPFVGSDEAR